MSRTVARLDSDQQYNDAIIPLSGTDFVNTSAGASAFTKIAAGEYSLRLTAAATAYVTVTTITGLIYRGGVQSDYQQAFGSSRAGGALGLAVGWPQTISTGSVVAGTAVSIPVFSSVNFVAGGFITVDTVASGVQEFSQITSIPDGAHIIATLKNAHTTPFPVTQGIFTTPGPVVGRPPFTGLSQLTPQTSAPAKGINIKQITMIYIVNTANASAPTIGLFATQYPHNAAPTVTTLIAQATNNLQTAFQASQYSVPVPVPVANQGFIVTPNTIVSVEFDITTGAAATVDILGVVITGSYIYN